MSESPRRGGLWRALESRCDHVYLATLSTSAALIGALALYSIHQAPEEAALLREIPDRFVSVLLDVPVSAPPAASPDAAEGTRTGKKDAWMLLARGNRVDLNKGHLDREIAESAGLLGAIDTISLAGRPLGTRDLTEGIGGLIGAPPAVSPETHTDHGDNPYTEVAADPLSTFSVDVDTASYTQARRTLHRDRTPHPASIRPEEFINNLDYDYPAPTRHPFDVAMEAMPDPLRPGHHILRIGVQGKALTRAERDPVHLTFLVDVSGSMSSADKLGLAKTSLHLLVDGLSETDTVALATYAGRVAEILPPTAVQHSDRIHEAIDGLRSGGSTAMSAGIDLAYGMADAGFVSGHENRVVILTDGDANVGATSWDELLSQIKGHADRGITLTTVGFGAANYRSTRLERLADNGDGNSFYIDSEKEAERVFMEELAGAMFTIARDVKIQVDFNPDSVARYRLIGYENRAIADRDFRNDRVDAGEIGAGHDVTALYDVVLAEGYDRSLATVRMRWEAPGADTGEASERAWRFASSQLTERPDQASPATRIAYTAATFAEILGQSPHAEGITLSALHDFARTAARPGEADDAELLDLIRRAQQSGMASR